MTSSVRRSRIGSGSGSSARVVGWAAKKPTVGGLEAAAPASRGRVL